MNLSLPDNMQYDEILEIGKDRLNPAVDDHVFHEALENPINASSIKNIGRDRKVTIIVSDNTRKLPFNKMVKAVLETIGEHHKENVRFLIATGTHRGIDPRSLGIDDAIIDNYAFHNHDSKDYQSMVHVGEVSPKGHLFHHNLSESFLKQFYELARESDKYIFTEEHMSSPEKVFLNKLAVETDLVVLIGRIKPHYFAGFSGGAKNLAPGCAGRHFILRNHLYKIHPSARNANLENNIVREELEEAASFCRNVFNYNVVLGPNDEVLDVVAGHMVDSHRKGAAICYDRLKVQSGKYDVVLVTDSWPVTMSLKQIKKVVASASSVVRENGVIIVFGECGEGLGSGSRLNDRIYQQHLEAIIPAGVDVFIHSSIEKKDIELSGFFQYLNGLEHGMDYAKAKLGNHLSTVLIPNGSIIIPEVIQE